MREFIEYLAMNDPLSLMPQDPYRLAKKYKLLDAEVCESAAAVKIRNQDDLLEYMSAAYVLRTHGNRKQVKLGERIDKLCRLHLEFGKSVTAVQAHMANELGER